MPGLQTAPGTGGVIPELRPSVGATKQYTSQLQQSQNSGDKLSGRMGASLQSQVDYVMSALRKPQPHPEQLTIIDQNGDEIAWIGYAVATNNVAYFGAWFAQLYVGGTGPQNAPFFANATGGVVIGQNGYVSIVDPQGVQVGWLGVQEDAAQAITATSNGLPDVITVPANGWNVGDTLLIKNSTGDTAINGERILAHILTADTFTMTDLVGNPINGNGAYAGFGTATRYFGGAWFETLAVGGTGFNNSVIRAYANGNVIITNAEITVTRNGVTTIIDNVNASGFVFGLTTMDQTTGYYAGIAYNGLILISGPPTPTILASLSGGLLQLASILGTASLLSTTALKFQNIQVVGPQLGSLANVAGTAGATYTVVEQALLNNVVTLADGLHARMVTHGLIAP